MSRITCALAIALFGAGCASSGDALRARAAHDFKCPESSLQFKRIDARTNAARGCGQEAVYVHVCQGAMDCTWVRND